MRKELRLLFACLLAALILVVVFGVPSTQATAPIEASYLWSTNGTGDGASAYTQADWAQIVKIMSSVPGGEGVGTLNNHCDATAGTNVITLATCVAIVDGKPYALSTAGTLAIPSASGGGNTRIDRIVLRADWTAQTVRAYRVPGTDAASPSAPTISTTRSSKFDLMLWQARVDTSGVVTVTDERQWGTTALAGSGLNVTTAGALRTSAGPIHRQGGSATNWATAGTSNYTETAGLTQVGSTQTSDSATTVITYPVAFSNKPLCVPAIINGGSVNLSALLLPDSTTLSVDVLDITGTRQIADVGWICMGPE